MSVENSCFVLVIYDIRLTPNTIETNKGTHNKKSCTQINSAYIIPKIMIETNKSHTLFVKIMYTNETLETNFLGIKMTKCELKIRWQACYGECDDYARSFRGWGFKTCTCQMKEKEDEEEEEEEEGEGEEDDESRRRRSNLTAKFFGHHNTRFSLSTAFT